MFRKAEMTGRCTEYCEEHELCQENTAGQMAKRPYACLFILPAVSETCTREKAVILLFFKGLK